MEKSIPIKTAVGLLQGRDCLYFDTLLQDDLDNMIFRGTINGALVDHSDKSLEWLPYQLSFRSVLACFSCELDTYLNMTGTDFLDGSSFDLIKDSKWLRTLPVRNDYDNNDYRHYRLLTYDVVYNIIAATYELEIAGIVAAID